MFGDFVNLILRILIEGAHVNLLSKLMSMNFVCSSNGMTILSICGFDLSVDPVKCRALIVCSENLNPVLPA